MRGRSLRARLRSDRIEVVHSIAMTLKPVLNLARLLRRTEEGPQHVVDAGAVLSREVRAMRVRATTLKPSLHVLWLVVAMLAALPLAQAGCATCRFSQSTRTTLRVEPDRLDFGRERNVMSLRIRFGETGNALTWRLVGVPEWVTAVPMSGDGVDIVTVTVDRSMVGTGETKARMHVLGATDERSIELRVVR